MSTVSVVIPTYRRTELLLTRSIPSVLAQTHREIELIVVADGMDPDEYEPMRSGVLALAPDAQVCNIERPSYPDDPVERWGLLAIDARNHGMERASGDWIACFDDDDEMLPDNLATLLAAAGDAEVVYGMSLTYKEGRSTGQLYGAWPPGPAQLTHGAVIMRRELPFRYEWSCQQRGECADADLWARMRDAGIRFVFVPQVICHYHRNYP